MKNKKSKVKLNPSDYEYLDDMQLEGWMWEFMRRNSDYRNLYFSLKETPISLTGSKDPTNHDSFFLDLSIRMSNTLKSIEEIFCIHFNLNNLKPFNSNHFASIEIKGTDQFLGLPNPDMKYKDFHEIKPFIMYSSPVKEYKIDEHLINKHEQVLAKDELDEEFEEYGDKTFNKHCAEIIEDILPTSGLRNTLYLGVSINAKIEDIKKEINKIIRQYIKPSPRKVRADRWKYYLITYDLKKQKIDYPEIIDILAKAYKEKGFILDLRKDIQELKKDTKKLKKEDTFCIDNIENYDQSATDLITGGYKKYLNLGK